MKSQYVLPITIVVAGALIAGAVFLVGKSNVPSTTDSTKVTARAYDPAVDHILGNPNAAVKVVEYMDLECPHCKEFNTTMHQIMDYYGPSGNVAWVQRSFPLGIFSKSTQEATAAECAASLGGNTAYFKFVDQIFAITPSENNLDLSKLPALATQTGLDVNKFNQCLQGGQFTKKIQDSHDEAIAAGAQGTPFILIMVGTDAVKLQGNQPYDSMRSAIDAVLQTIPGLPNASSTPSASPTPATQTPAAQTLTH